VTLKCSLLLDSGNTLGHDELDKGCKAWCFEIHYTIAKLPVP
jgi:hypothetical protein